VPLRTTTQEKSWHRQTWGPCACTCYRLTYRITPVAVGAHVQARREGRTARSRNFGMVQSSTESLPRPSPSARSYGAFYSGFESCLVNAAFACSPIRPARVRVECSIEVPGRGMQRVPVTSCRPADASRVFKSYWNIDTSVSQFQAKPVLRVTCVLPGLNNWMSDKQFSIERRRRHTPTTH
jgi:hypothetical protein